MRVDPTSRLRMWGYCLALTAFAFVQEPGRIVGDTKFDLAVDPAGFLARAANLWDPTAAFGQIQNQAYGYFWPMGPFFVLGDAVGLQAWVVQRLWWAALLCLAFVGTVKVARALDLGRPWAQVVAGFAFALSAHTLTLLGPTSVEAWPSAWAPWVLLPLIHASREGSVRRGAALSALAVAMCGGVNAVAVSAVLPLPLIWLATRERGRRRLQLALWWILFTALATLWWAVPLVLLGRYSVPFLDYIENAPITTQPTSLPDVLAGTSDWVAYIASNDWVAGNLLATTPFLLVNAAVLVGVGVAGIVHGGNPHRHFLFLGLLVGVALVGFGYTGPLHGWWAGERLVLLDAELAPFRNLHKYDVVLRLALVLGLTHFLTLVAESARTAPSKTVHRMVVLVTVVSVVGLAVPVYAGRLAPGGSFEAVPDYWQEVADYLEENAEGVSVELPASAFGDYSWGSPRDDVLQPLARSPWAVRNIIPLAQPGNVRFLDTLTSVVEGGRPSPSLAAALAAGGVSNLVVRNDLSRLKSGAPDPVVLHQALDGSPGLTKVAEFGPDIGQEAVSYTENDIRIVGNRGRQAAFAAVEVYAVEGAGGQVSAWEAGSVPVVAGGPASGLRYDAGLLDGPAVLAGDRSRAFAESPTVLTDGLRRREMAFTSVRENESHTMGAGEPWTLPSVVPNHRLYDRQQRFETLARWVGVRSVRASTAQSEAAALPPVRRDRAPAAAVDGAPSTGWVSTGFGGAVGQWWRVELDRHALLSHVTIRGRATIGPPVTRIRITTDAGTRVADAPDADRPTTYALPDGPTDTVKIEAVRVRDGGRGVHFGLSEVVLPGVRAERFLATPDVFEDAPDQILLAREPERPACALVEGHWLCDDFWAASGEERFALRRLVTLAGEAEYDVALTATPRRGPVTVDRIFDELPFRVDTSQPLSHDLRASGLAVVDGDPGTAWVASPGESPFLRLSWDEPVELGAIELELSDAVPGAKPLEVALGAGRQLRVVELEDGRGEFDELVTDELLIRFSGLEEAYSFEGGRAIELPVAVGEIRFPGAEVPAVDRDEALAFPCGSGPRISVGDASLPTRLVASLGELLSGDPLPVATCGGSVVMRAGVNEVRVGRSRLVRPGELRLTRVDFSSTATADPVAVEPTRWSPTGRTVQVADRDEPTLLVVAENINAGWTAELDGRRLRPQRVDGWAQGWIVPPGGAAQIELRFAPDTGYRTALLVGALGLLLVAVAAALPGRRGLHAPAGTSRGAAWLVVGLSPLVGGLLAGWVGFVAMGVAVALGGAARALTWAPFAAGLMVAAGGALHAAARADEFRMHFLPAQLLALLGLSVAAATFAAKGPAFFRRRKRRSRE